MYESDYNKAALSAAFTIAETNDLFAEKFTNLTGIEPLNYVETTEHKSAVLSVVQPFLAGMVETNLVSQEEGERILGYWRNLLYFDDEGLGRLTRIYVNPYIQMQQELQAHSGYPDAEEIVKKADLVVALLTSSFNTAGAGTVRLPIGFEQKAIEIGFPNLYLFMAWRKGSTEMLKEPAYVEMIAMEETCHLISKLEKYGLKSKWAEEMMARVVRFNLSFGHREGTDNYEEIKKISRADQYVRLFGLVHSRLQASGVDEMTLMNMFFGRTDLNSDDVTKVISIIEELDFVGTMVDHDIPIDKLSSSIDV